MPAEISEEELRGVFEKIDLDKSGSIDHSELHTGMRMLGIKVSDNSARKVLKLVDTDGNGTIEWPEFKDFFGRVSNADGVKMMLSTVNQRFFEYKAKVEGDASFAKTFKIPPFGPNPKVLDTYHVDQIEEVLWLSDSRFATGSLDGLIKVWDRTQLGSFPKPVQTIKLGTALYSMAATTDGRALFAGTDTGHVLSWDPETGAESVRYEGDKFQGHDDPVFSCATDDTECVMAGHKSGHICLFDLQSSKCALRWRPHEGIVYSMQYGPSPNVFCSASADGTVAVSDTRSVAPDKADSKTNGVVVRIEDAAASEKVFRARWRGDREIVTCGDDYCIKRWDLRKLDDGPVGSYFGHTSPVRALTVSPDGRFLVSGTVTGGARLWLADELALATELFDASNATYKAHAGRRQEIVDLIQNGEAHDKEELQAETAAMEQAQQEMLRLKRIKGEYAALDCTQAAMALDSPAMAVSSVAWRDLGDGTACLLCGAYDQRVRIFTLNTAEMYKLK